MIQQLRAVDVSTAEWQIIRDACNRWENEYLQTMLCLFLPFWVRSPLTWKGRTAASLVTHLLHRHPVPKCLELVWRTAPDEWEGLDSGSLKWHVWSIVLGQGGSLKHTSRRFHWDVAGKFQYHLEHTPDSLTLVEAAIRAEVIRLGGMEGDFDLVNTHPAFREDPTEFSLHTDGMGEFWTDTVRWLIANRDELSTAEAHEALTWAVHRFTEANREGVSFSWKGRSPAAVRRHAVAYRDQLGSQRSYARWNSRGWNWEEELEAGTWSFVELTTGWQLEQEGRALHHCVGGYSWSCQNGHSAIVSLRWNDQRRITIQVDLESLTVVQARGVCNRGATPEEQRIIKRWTEEVLKAAMLA